MKRAGRYSYDDRGREDKKSMVVNMKMKVKKWKIFMRSKKHENVGGVPSLWDSQVKEKDSDPDEYEEQYPEFYGAPSNFMIPFSLETT